MENVEQSNGFRLLIENSTFENENILDTLTINNIATISILNRWARSEPLETDHTLNPDIHPQKFFRTHTLNMFYQTLQRSSSLAEIQRN